MKCCRCGVSETESTVPLEQSDGKVYCASCIHEMPSAHTTLIAVDDLTSVKEAITDAMLDEIIRQLAVPATLLEGRAGS